jgi:hypothetical protein
MSDQYMQLDNVPSMTGKAIGPSRHNGEHGYVLRIAEPDGKVGSYLTDQVGMERATARKTPRGKAHAGLVTRVAGLVRRANRRRPQPQASPQARDDAQSGHHVCPGWSAPR